MSENTFERVEKKYQLTSNQAQFFLEKSKDYIHIDEYGMSTISNLYFDNQQDDCIRWSIEKPAYKEKLRIRTYQGDGQSDIVYVELKKKADGVVYKRRIQTTLVEALALCAGKKEENPSQIRKEIEYFVEFYHPIPKAYLAYDRMAYLGADGLRITFDTKIRFRQEELSLKPNLIDTVILPEFQVLMEIKVSGAFPFWLSRLLSELEIYPTSYSKYGTVYKEYLFETESFKEEDLCFQVYCPQLQEV